jgi:hydrogenase maturation factor
MNETNCQFDAAGHCFTCSDEAQPATILHIYPGHESALVIFDNTSTQEIDISLLENVTPGDLVLVHAGVAISQELE